MLIQEVLNFLDVLRDCVGGCDAVRLVGVLRGVDWDAVFVERNCDHDVLLARSDV